MHNSTPIEAGIQLFPLAIAGALASLLAPPLGRLIGSRSVLAGGLVVAGAGLIYLYFAGTNLSLSNIFISLSLVSAGMGSLAVGSAMIMGGVPPQ